MDNRNELRIRVARRKLELLLKDLKVIIKATNELKLSNDPQLVEHSYAMLSKVSRDLSWLSEQLAHLVVDREPAPSSGFNEGERLTCGFCGCDYQVFTRLKHSWGHCPDCGAV